MAEPLYALRSLLPAPLRQLVHDFVVWYPKEPHPTAKLIKEVLRIERLGWVPRDWTFEEVCNLTAIQLCAPPGAHFIMSKGSMGFEGGPYHIFTKREEEREFRVLTDTAEGGELHSYDVMPDFDLT
jgi:hypothetical protein